MLPPIWIILDLVRCAVFHFVFKLLEYCPGIYPRELHLESPHAPGYWLALYHQKNKKLHCQGNRRTIMPYTTKFQVVFYRWKVGLLSLLHQPRMHEIHDVLCKPVQGITLVHKSLLKYKVCTLAPLRWCHPPAVIFLKICRDKTSPLLVQALRCRIIL